MFSIHKSKYQIVALRRKNISNFKKKINVYDILLCNNSKHNKKFIIEKLGSCSDKFFFINNFRLIYWLQFNVSFNIRASKVINKYIYILNKIAKI